MAAQHQPRALSLSRALRWSTYVLFNTLFLLCACTPLEEEEAEGPWILSGMWTVEGSGSLSDCPDPFYHSEEVDLQSRMFRVEASDGALRRVDTVSGFEFDGEQVPAINEEEGDLIRFSTAEKLNDSETEQLTLSFEGRWLKPKIIEGRVEGRVKGCTFQGDFCVRIIADEQETPPAADQGGLIMLPPGAPDRGHPEDEPGETTPDP
ncbi:MAG: hypothetical protein VYD19_02325 [Myxococcota bacterium]|nr:hypothetical protein [Myxococcota bacterium]